MDKARIRDVLVRARALIEKPEAWTKNTFARDKDGDEVSRALDEAVCWCAAGAIYRSCEGDFETYRYATQAVRHAVGLGDFEVTHKSIGEDWNDISDHATVLAGLDRAIASLESP